MSITWVLVLTIFTTDGTSSQQILMSENNCRYYEQQYNVGKFNRAFGHGEAYLRYNAQCLRAF